ncbi:E3 ubiquitin-protein ligase TTC3-like isoform X2 [Pristis pectinata]|uniref:E3 ubiquitin-protein ligase TTC3-like isoform X2 n=1 Tax=Pristis pectinata TaxID=685728 RepID=UPI00223E301E|nr:E3 ubiquitin-protein ligase TTC3-like isoform X2 [Pristis pectinata]
MKSSISVGEMAFDWCKMSSDRYLQHCHLAFINVFDELLFRQQHEPTRYLKWAQEGLLLSKKVIPFVEKHHDAGGTQQARQHPWRKASGRRFGNCKGEAVDLTVIQTMEIFWILYAEMKKKCNQTGFVAALLKTFEQTKDDVELKEIICCTKPLIKQIPINNIAPNWTDLQRNTALTILLAHFADYIKKFADEGDSLLNDFERNCECNNQKIEHLQWKGEDEVSISEFTAAILTYSKAVEMSPYNHHLYCRRAYCYLQLNDHRTAILDSIRATVLKPDYFKGHYFCAKGLLSAGYPDYALVVNRRGIDLCLVGRSDITALQEQRSEIQEEMKKKGNCETTEEQHSSSKKATVVGGDDSPVPEPGSDTDIESLEGEESVGDFRGEKFQAAWENLIDNLTETNCKVFDELPEESETSIESQKSTPRTEKTNSCEELPPDPTEQYEEENSSRKISEPRSADKIVFDPSKCRLWRAVHSEQDLITQGVEDISFLLYRLKLKKFLSEGDQEEVEKQSTGPSKLDALLRIVLKKNSNLEIRKFTSVLVAIDGLKPELSKWVQNLEEMGNSCADSFLYLYLEVLAEPLNGIPLRDLIYSLQTRNILTDVENDLLMKTSPVHRGQRLLEVIVYMKSAAEKAEFVFLLEEERRSFPTLRKCLDEFQQEFEKLRDGYIPRFKRYMPLKRLRRREDLPADERNSYCNFFRLMYLIILEGTRMAQKVFAERVPPSDLQAEIRKLKKAELHRHFREFQATFASHSDWGLLYPQKASRLEFQKYDVTLIVFLMMHVKSFPQPRKGWRTEPPPDDHSKPASLLRLLYLRRRLVLRDGYLGVPEEEFLAMWSEAKQCLCWLGKDHEEIEDIMFTPGYLLWRDHKLIAELMGRQCSEMTGQYMMAMKAHLQTKTKEVMKMGETKAEPPPGGKENPAPATGTATPDRREKEAETGGEGEIALGQDATEKENSLSFQVTAKGEGSSRPSETQCANDPQRNSRKKKKKKTKGKKKSAIPVENVSEKDVESTADEDRDEDVSQASHQDLRGKNELAELEAAVRRWQLLCEEKSSQYEQLLKRQSKTLESCKQQTAEVQRLKQEMENERKMQQNDKKVLQNQIKNLQEVLQSKEELVKKSEKQIQAQEQELQQQEKQAQQERDQWTQEKSRLERQSAKSKDEFIEAMRRAMAAEVQVLECRRDKATVFLEQAAKEGEVKLSGLRQKLVSGPAVQIDVKAAIMAYEMVLADIKSKIHQTVSAFNEQIDLIRNGAKLSNMPQVPVVLPPSQSDFMLIYMTKQKELLASSGFPANNNSQGTTSTLPAFPPGMAPLNNQLGITQRSMSPGLPTQPSSLGPANPSQGGTSNQNHLERLLEKLTELFPQHNRDMMIVFLRQVRMMNNNSLSGLSFEQIISQVSVLIKNHQPHLVNVNLDFASLPTDPMSSTVTWRNVAKDPHVNRLGFMSGLSHQSGVGTEPGHQKEEEDPCVICQEELTSSRLFVMKCGHKYHRECISLWLKDQKTCPSCTLSFATSFSQS